VHKEKNDHAGELHHYTTVVLCSKRHYEPGCVTC